jgi:hypothetical protein
MSRVAMLRSQAAEKDLSPRSHTLFHFMRSRKHLQQALVRGFWPRYSWEDTQWLDKPKIRHVAYPMICFCDIPLSRIGDHVTFYGEYGLGMTREWAARIGMNPVIYLEGKSRLRDAIWNVIDATSDSFKKGDKLGFTSALRHLAYVKPTEGEVSIRGKRRAKDFYQESEWRFVAEPKEESHEFKVRIVSGDATPPELADENERVRLHASIQIVPSDVRYIFVKSDADIPSVMTFMETNLKHHSSADLKILLSRVTSLESLRRDA